MPTSETRERELETMRNTTAEQAIARSISHTEIVTIEFDSDAEAALNAACENSVVANNRTEYWGADDDGNEWRVHMNIL